MNQLRSTLAAGVMLCGLLVPAVGTAAAEPVTAVPQLDVNKLMGVWYEVALYPRKPEKKCVSDTRVLYALGDKAKKFQVVTSCSIKGDNSDAWNATATLSKAGDGKLKLSYVFPFSQKYWVLATGPGFEWALIGSPNHHALWILARTPTLSPEVLAEVKAKAAAEGYDTSKLVTRFQLHR
jgi:apolipoprotein D and lipocalin family protein